MRRPCRFYGDPRDDLRRFGKGRMVNFTKVDPTDLDESDLDEINEALGADDADDGVNNPGSAAAQDVSDLANSSSRQIQILSVATPCTG